MREAEWNGIRPYEGAESCLMTSDILASSVQQNVYDGCILMMQRAECVEKVVNWPIICTPIMRLANECHNSFW